MAKAYESWASSAAARNVMRANRRRDTTPELAVRRLVHAAGLRYRVDTRPLPSLNRRADLVFTRARVAVFIDGCYWHGCAEHGTSPKTNAEFWRTKIAVNRARDAETDAALAAAGWDIVRAWEHEDPVVVAGRVIEAVKAGVASPSIGNQDAESDSASEPTRSRSPSSPKTSISRNP